MSAPRVLEVTVERDGKWWVFELPELGAAGQAHTLAEIEHEARGVASAWLDVPYEAVAVDVTVKAPERVLAEWEQAERDEQAARAAQASAAARKRAVVRELRQDMKAPDVGRVLGISKQRVYQLEKPEVKAS